MDIYIRRAYFNGHHCKRRTAVFMTIFVCVAVLFLDLRVYASEAKQELVISGHTYMVGDTSLLGGEREGYILKEVEIADEKIKAWISEEDENYYQFILEDGDGNWGLYCYDADEGTLQLLNLLEPGDERENRTGGEDARILKQRQYELIAAISIFVFLFLIAVKIGSMKEVRRIGSQKRAQMYAQRIEASYGDLELKAEEEENTAEPDIQDEADAFRALKPRLLKIYEQDGVIFVRWARVPSASGYIVLRKKDGCEWKRICRIFHNRENFFKDIDIEAGKTYAYTICAFRKMEDQEIESDHDETGLVRQAVRGNKLKTPKLLSIRQQGTGIEIVWESVRKADGYIIMRKTDKGTYKRIKRIKDSNQNSYADMKISQGHTYSYSVRAFRYIEKDTSVDSDYEKPGMSLKVQKLMKEQSNE